MTINLITLGCSKNLVDSEKLLYQLKRNGHETVHNSGKYAEAIIINTCGFILDAKTESIDTILNYVRSKKEGLIKKLVVMGCLSERYRETLKEEIPEVDGIFGVNDIQDIISFFNGNYYVNSLYKRIISSPAHYAYLKISEGCNRKCAFCAIPSIRGKQVSLPIESLVKEAEEIASRGAREIILIAQELSSYGMDIYRRRALPELLHELIKIQSIEWIRLHYIYPDNFPAREIIDLMKRYPQICRYLDIPVQHASDPVLKRMRRGHNREDIEKIIGLFRKEIPEISVRTTVITGFPGETEEDFETLKEFVKNTRFDRLGVFSYSHEEGTPAFSLEEDVPPEVKESRLEEIMKIQEEISLQANLNKVGSKLKVLIDRQEGEFYVGRSEFDSPEVDNEVLIPAESSDLKIGEFYEVKIYDAIEYDVYGRLE